MASEQHASSSGHVASSSGHVAEDKPYHRKTVPLSCPRCSSTEVRRSRRTSLLEHVAALVLLYPYRCRRCMHRFFTALERIRHFRYASCPRCGNYFLERISKHRVPARYLKSIQPLLHRHAYRCDSCRWRFFDSRRLAPKDLNRPAQPPPASEPTATRSA